MVQFLRQPNIQDVLKDKYPPYASSSPLKEKVHKICTGGTEALDKMSNDLQLTMMLRSGNDISVYFCYRIIDLHWGQYVVLLTCLKVILTTDTFQGQHFLGRSANLYIDQNLNPAAKSQQKKLLTALWCILSSIGDTSFIVQLKYLVVMKVSESIIENVCQTRMCSTQSEFSEFISLW